jgi:hypothetical protein
LFTYSKYIEKNELYHLVIRIETMTLTCIVISDIHEEDQDKIFEWITPCAGIDVCIIAGDLTDAHISGRSHNTEIRPLIYAISFITRLVESKYFKHILYTPGNHEYWMYNHGNEFTASTVDVYPNFHLLDCSIPINKIKGNKHSIIINGITFVGCSGTVLTSKKNRHRYHESPNYKADSVARIPNIPIHVLVTHQNPLNNYDMFNGEPYNRKNGPHHLNHKTRDMWKHESLIVHVYGHNHIPEWNEYFDGEKTLLTMSNPYMLRRKGLTRMLTSVEIVSTKEARCCCIPEYTIPISTVKVNNSRISTPVIKKSTDKGEPIFKSVIEIIWKLTNKVFVKHYYNTVGQAVSSAYKRRYNGEKPIKDERVVDGIRMFVNVYEKKDWDLVEDILNQYGNV